jgi:coniferyl-aldehyde dehydrogenase
MSTAENIMIATETGTRASASVRALFDAQRADFLASVPPPLEQRRHDLKRLGEAIRRDADTLAAAISADFGHRSRHETEIAEVFPALSAIRETMRHLPRWMRPRAVPAGLEFMPGKARILCQPLGVVGIISPWNYPFQLAVVPLVAALAAGNRVMVKPSELTPRTSDFMAALFSELFPATQVATVTGGAEIGQAFSQLPFDHLFFTGSTSVGRQVMRAASDNLTPVTLELGGKSPAIISDDADLANAAGGIIHGKLLNAGQTCIAPDYVLLPQSRLEDFVALIERTIRKFYPALGANPDYSAIIDGRHYQRLTQYVAEAKTAGARVIEINSAAEALPASARKLAPTLVIDPDDNLAVMREEIFGPVLPIKSYRRIDEAIDYVNRHPRPLALYYFGADAATRDRVLARTVSGGVTVNGTLIHFAVENLPFGGVGASGMGAYHGETGFLTFSHRKSVFFQGRISAAPLLRPPFGRIADLAIRVLRSRF